MAMNGNKSPINLLRGWPSASLLPTSQIRAAAQIALSDPSIATTGLLYGPDPGYGPLRIEVSKWLSSFYDVPDDASRICITGGASQNLACILQVFTDPSVTKRIWMVAPCYFLACRIFEDAGFAGRLKAVPEDEDGIDVDYLETEMAKTQNENERFGRDLKPERPWCKTFDHIIYAVPDFSNPSGKTMSLRRRHRLVQIARDYNALIITDDVYDRLQWPTGNTAGGTSRRREEKAHLPRLTDIDRDLAPHPADPRRFGHTLSNGSFSKIIGPGVRTGWVDANPPLAYGLSQCGSSRSGGCPSQLVATMITEIIRNGSLREHINSVLVPSYARRWQRMMSAVERLLIPLGVSASDVNLAESGVFGGYFIWFELPEGMTADRVAVMAKEKENLKLAHGNLFEVYGDKEAVKFDQWMRVCFAWEDEDKLEEGILRLARIVESLLPTGDKDSRGEEKPAVSFRATGTSRQLTKLNMGHRKYEYHIVQVLN